ncbi:MAG: GMC family oxidoreductase [Deltaproteobacteria bacterium]|nr:GMC family oxidoreductase [Deltaproteobacteria bacterium]
MSGPGGFDCDWVVIGSGFGGSVAAMRLAQKGYDVTLLEAGRRWRAEDLPTSSWDLDFNWLPALGCYGLMRMDLWRHALAWGGTGVGGGSLIYGNTLFVPLDSFFEAPAIATLGGAKALLPYFDLAKKMMGVVANPRLFEPDRFLRETAEEYGRGDTFTPSPVAVYFGEPDEEVPDPYFLGEGEPRTGCTFCGACFVGCRVGAKNSLDRNYLWFAERFGCRVCSRTRALAIRPLSEDGSGGYEVETERLTLNLRRPRQTIRARGVVVAGGVMGTLELLLACKQAGYLPRLSDQLGHRVRTNSEAIVGVTARDRSTDYSEGIAASSSVFPDLHTQVQADRYPAGSDSFSLLSTLLVDGGGWLPRPLRFLDAVRRRPLDFLRILPPFGFARRTIFLIVMQDLDSSLRIERRRRWWWPLSHRLVSRSSGADRVPTYVPMANDFTRRLAARMNGIARSSVTEVFLDRPATAHILGGCPIGESPAEGVIDGRQRVFGYENLLVCDGTVIPANLGVNPALSILAFAERAMSFVPPKAPDSVQTLKVERVWGVEGLLTR